MAFMDIWGGVQQIFRPSIEFSFESCISIGSRGKHNSNTTGLFIKV